MVPKRKRELHEPAEPDYYLSLGQVDEFTTNLTGKEDGGRDIVAKVAPAIAQLGGSDPYGSQRNRFGIHKSPLA